MFNLQSSCKNQQQYEIKYSNVILSISFAFNASILLNIKLLSVLHLTFLLDEMYREIKLKMNPNAVASQLSNCT